MSATMHSWEESGHNRFRANMTDMEEPIKSEVELLAAVLRRSNFCIPPYQRPYAWEPEHVTALLDDLADCIAHKQPHYFLGTIMLISPRQGNRLDINDGQQRIATFMLICANLCRHFQDCGYSSGESRALRMLFDLSESHDKTLSDADSLTPRVVLSTNDKPTYEALTCGHPVHRNGKMKEAWKAIDDFFKQPEYEATEKKRDFFSFLANNVLVSWIKFEDEVDSLSVFETQNTRGKSLEQIQVACTYFFSCVRYDEQRSERIHEQLDRIRTNMKNDEAKFFDYARCFAQCRYGYLSADRFSRDLRQQAEDAQSDRAIEISEFVHAISEGYRMQAFHALTTSRSSDSVWDQLTADARQTNRLRKIRDYLKDLQKYPSVSNPILFALLCEHARFSDSPKQREKALFVYNSAELLASFFQRTTHSSAGSFTPSHYEKSVAELSQKIANGKCATPKNFLAFLRTMDKENIIADSDYKNRMRTMIYPSKSARNKAKYVLAKINERIQKGLTVPDRGVSIEHILPQSQDYLPGWDFTTDAHGRCVNRLGNLTLLAPKENGASQTENADFAAKKPVFARSAYEIAKRVNTWDKWDEKAVDQRQKGLANIAAEIWRFKVG